MSIHAMEYHVNFLMQLIYIYWPRKYTKLTLLSEYKFAKYCLQYDSAYIKNKAYIKSTMYFLCGSKFI